LPAVYKRGPFPPSTPKLVSEVSLLPLPSSPPRACSLLLRRRRSRVSNTLSPLRYSLSALTGPRAGLTFRWHREHSQVGAQGANAGSPDGAFRKVAPKAPSPSRWRPQIPSRRRLVAFHWLVTSPWVVARERCHRDSFALQELIGYRTTPLFPRVHSLHPE